jgi:hypothetical protein
MLSNLRFFSTQKIKKIEKVQSSNYFARERERERERALQPSVKDTSIISEKEKSRYSVSQQ